MKLALALGGTYVLFAAWALPLLSPNFDEGVYVAQARLVWNAELPYRDFFYHQTPLYLALLAPLSHLGAWSLLAARALSLASSAAAGVVLSRLVSPHFGERGALATQLLFYIPPLAQYGLLALPNGAMVACSVFAFFLLLDRDAAFGAGVIAAVAVFIKPLAASSALALAIVGLFKGRRVALRVIAGGATGGVTLFLASEWASGGAFSDVLLLQAGRYGARGGFDLMAALPEFAATMQARGVSGPISWSLAEHAHSFFSWGPLNGNLWLLGLALLSPLWWHANPLRRPCAAWLSLPLAFNLLVWEPAWDHYFLQYLPVLAVAGGLTAEHALRMRPRVAVIAGAAVMTLTVTLRPLTPQALDNLRTVASQGEEVFCFNPLVHAASGSSPACEMIDPLNVYGEHCAAALAPEGPLARFRVSEAELIECLGDETPVIIDPFTFWFASPELLQWLRESPERLRFVSPRDQVRFEMQTVSAAGRIE